MPLSPAIRLGPYEIQSLLGAGGMGEVYRARDPRMGRDVAINISAEQFSDRFSREVHAVAALNHPNICHLYDVGPRVGRGADAGRADQSGRYAARRSAACGFSDSNLPLI